MSESTQVLPKTKTALFFSVAPGVWGSRDLFVNMYFIQNPEDDSWVLVDAGLKTSYSRIKKVVTLLFGEGSKPSAIILTHGHFDHVGSLRKLEEEWQVPVYAHYLELPYLTGRSAYPPPDSTVGGGAFATFAFLYPKRPIDLGGAINVLPEDHSVPGLPSWKWIHTPGHTPGHISLFRQENKTLIAGDAFVTTKSESIFSTIKQKEVVSGPPKYYTSDWISSEQSVKKLAAINPSVVASGHGQPMYGEEVQEQLRDLADHFEEKAIPRKGRYVSEPSVADATGVLYIPKLEQNRKKQAIVIAAAVVIVAGLTYLISSQRKKRKSRWF